MMKSVKFYREASVIMFIESGSIVDNVELPKLVYM